MKFDAKLIVGILTLLFLYSCEGGTTFTKEINNASSETLTVSLYSSSWSDTNTTIGPNERKDIYFIWVMFLVIYTMNDIRDSFSRCSK